MNNDFYEHICKIWAHKFCEDEMYQAFMKANCPRACCCRKNCDCGDLCLDHPDFALQVE